MILILLESDDADNELKKFTAVLNGDASSGYQNSSCALPKQTGANLTCTVNILNVFNK